MPWSIKKDAPGCAGWAVVKQSDGKVVGCHTTETAAKKQLAALNINVAEASMVDVKPRTEFPRENLVRAVSNGFEVRKDDAGKRTLFGHFNRFGEWAEIDSVFEGHFMERFVPGSLTKTLAERRDRIKMTFNHGRDPDMGNKVIASITDLREDERGGYYEGDLLDGVPPLIVSGLERGEYGASMQFGVVRDDVVKDPGVSDHNPKGLPERTVTEARIHEFGPVTFPAYAGATTSIRSLTDEFVFDRLTADRARAKQLVEFVNEKETPAPSARSAPADATPSQERRVTAPTTRKEEHKVAVDIDRFTSVETLAARLDEITQRRSYLDQEWAGRAFDTDAQAEWDDLKEERKAIEERVSHLKDRQAEIEGDKPTERTTTTVAEPVKPQTRTTNTPTKSAIPENIFDLGAYRQNARSMDHAERLYTDGAKRAIELARFPSDKVKREDAQESALKTLMEAQGGDSDDPDSTKAKIARHMLATGTEVYKRAVGKYMLHQDTAALTPDESHALYAARALSLTGGSGGFAVPFELDPTMILTNAGTINFIRQISRVIQITVDEWRGITSAGVTASYQAEATETTDDAPTLVQPTISTEKAQVFVPFSIEVGMDWDSLQAEMGRAFADAKDRLEASKFVSGSGTNEPFGVLTGTTNTVAAAAGQTFTLANLYALLNAVPARFQASFAWMGNLAVANRIRQFDTAGGAALWATLGADVPDRLLGRPWYQGSDMADVATSVKFLLAGDFSRYVIVDRVGLSVDLIPHLFGTNHRPTGQRGLYAFWRNGAKVIDASAFRALLGTA